VEQGRTVGVVKRVALVVNAWRPVRVFQRYVSKHGDLLSAGMSVSALFSVFAMLYVGFAVAGLYLQGSPKVRDSFVELVNTSVPGLIDTGDGGAINLTDLFDAQILGWTGVIAVLVLTFTSLGWLGATRDAVRAIFDLPPQKTFFLLLKLKDLGLIVGFGIAMIVSAALSVGSTSALTLIFSAVGIGQGSALFRFAIRVAVLLIVLVLDTLVLATLFRVLSGVVIPWRRLVTGSLIGAVALGILKVLGSSLIGGAGRNPLLTSFAVIVGILVWFSLICRVILLAASWIAVDMNDHGLTGAKLAVDAGMTPAPKEPQTRARRAIGRR
jgi:membrane protein